MLAELQSEILSLNARYAQAIDDNRLDEWPGFFTDAARYIVTTAENFEQGLPLSRSAPICGGKSDPEIRPSREDQSDVAPNKLCKVSVSSRANQRCRD